MRQNHLVLHPVECVPSLYHAHSPEHGDSEQLYKDQGIWSPAWGPELDDTTVRKGMANLDRLSVHHAPKEVQEIEADSFEVLHTEVSWPRRVWV